MRIFKNKSKSTRYRVVKMFGERWIYIGPFRIVIR